MIFFFFMFCSTWAKKITAQSGARIAQYFWVTDNLVVVIYSQRCVRVVWLIRLEICVHAFKTNSDTSNDFVYLPKPAMGGLAML